MMMPPMRRKILFVKYYDKGSTVMGADQISEALRAKGVDSRAIYPAELPRVRDSFLVFIKTSKIHHLLAARRRGNTTILDVQDTVVFKRRIKNRRLFHGLILKNERQLRDFATPRHNARILLHQWDPRYRENTLDGREIRLAYLGLERSLPLWNRIPGVAFHDHDYFRHGLDYNGHISLRQPGREYLYKPNCKVSTAAACAANLVTTRDVSAVELLGDDYPFYCEGTAEGLLQGIEEMRRQFGSAAWKRGLDRMREIRERTSIERIADDYLDYFASF